MITNLEPMLSQESDEELTGLEPELSRRTDDFYFVHKGGLPFFQAYNANFDFNGDKIDCVSITGWQDIDTQKWQIHIVMREIPPLSKNGVCNLKLPMDKHKWLSGKFLSMSGHRQYSMYYYDFESLEIF